MNEENPNDRMLTPRPVRDSQSEMAEIVLPNDANPLGALLGGRLMHWITLPGPWRPTAIRAATQLLLQSITLIFLCRFESATW